MPNVAFSRGFVANLPATGTDGTWYITTDTFGIYYSDGTTRHQVTGLISLNGLTGRTQTFTDDTNVTIVSGGTAHVITWSGQLSAARGGTGLDSSGWAQGDIVYISAAGTWNHLAKDANATRYLSNTGTSNNPAWAQVDLTNGVTGTLPTANIADNAVTNGKLRDSSAVSVIGRSANSSGDPADIAASAVGQTLSYAGTTIAFRGGWVLLSTATASSSATVDFTLPTGYAAFIVIFDHVAPATDAVSFYFRTSTDGGSTYDAGGSDYGWCLWSFTDAAGSGAAAGTGDNNITLGTSLGNSTNEYASGRLTIYRPSAAQHAYVDWQMSYMFSTGVFLGVTGSGRRIAAADVDAIRFLMSSGNVASGEFRLYGLGDA